MSLIFFSIIITKAQIGIISTAVLIFLFVIVLDDYAPGSHDVGDPSTTNLYLGNINPQVILGK